MQAHDVDAVLVQARGHFLRRRFVGEIRARRHVDADKPDAPPLLIVEMPSLRQDKAVRARRSRIQRGHTGQCRRGIVPGQREREGGIISGVCSHYGKEETGEQS